MAYIGNTPALQYITHAKQTFTADSSAVAFTLSQAVANENELEVFVNNVRQEPGSGKAYTASGTTLTMSAAPTTGDSFYCIYQGKATQTVTPGASTVTNDMLSGSIANAKLANSSITLNSSAVSLGGSHTLANTPAFQAYRTSYQSISNSTETKVQNNIELFDTDSAYDNTTNYRFTVPSGKAGKYLIGAGNTIDNVTHQGWVITRVRKNGSDLKSVLAHSSGGHPVSAELSFTDNASVGDYYESWVKHLDGSTSDLRTEYTNYFWMMRIIGA